jgi:hypothetical protein
MTQSRQSPCGKTGRNNVAELYGPHYRAFRCDAWHASF